jgi:hypothetical protein
MYMFGIIEYNTRLFSSLLRNNFAGSLQNQSWTGDNIKTEELFKDSDVQERLNAINTLLNEKIEDDSSWFEIWTTKKEIMNKWLWKDVKVSDDWLVDKQVKDLLIKMNAFDASKNEIKKATILLLSEVEEKVKNSLSKRFASNDDYANWLLDRTDVSGFDEKQAKSFRDKLWRSLFAEQKTLLSTMKDFNFNSIHTKEDLDTKDSGTKVGKIEWKVKALNQRFDDFLSVINPKKYKAMLSRVQIDFSNFEARIAKRKIAIEIVWANQKKSILVKEVDNFDFKWIQTKTELKTKSKPLVVRVRALNVILKGLWLSLLSLKSFSNKVVKKENELEWGLIGEASKLLKVWASINTDVFTRTLKKWMKWADVIALQEFLGINPDGTFGTQTEYALKAYQKTLGYKSPDWTLSVGKTKTYKTLGAIKDTLAYKGSSTNIYRRKANYKDVKESVEASTKRVEALTKLVENSDEFYTALEAWMDGWFRDDVLSDMWGVLWWGRELFWANNGDDYFEQIKGYKKSIEDKKNVFNKALVGLLPTKLDSKWLPYNERQKSVAWYAFRDVVIIGLVFKDLALFDIRLNFAKRLASFGVPMDKALAFRNWVEGGMEWEPDYSEENLKEISGRDALSSLWKFRATLTAYGFSSDKINASLSWDLKSLSDKEKKLLRVIFEKRVIPDLVTLSEWGFNWLERWFDDKDDKIENILRKFRWEEYVVLPRGVDVQEKDSVYSVVSEGKVYGTFDHYPTHKEIKKSIKWKVAYRHFESNNNLEKYNAILRKVGDSYILEVDDWGYNTYKSFDHFPTQKEIEDSVSHYSEWDKVAQKDGWLDYEFVYESEDIDYDYSGTGRVATLVKLSKGYLLEYGWKYKSFSLKPTQEQVDEAFEKSKSWKDSVIEWTYNRDLSISHLLKDTWKILDLLKEQDKEGRWLGDGWELKKGISRVESRVDYASGLLQQRIFLENAMKLLNTKNKALFERYSLLKVFGNIHYFLSEFPAPERVATHLRKLENPSNEQRYIKTLQSVLENTDIVEYLKIVRNASQDNTWMKAWKKYRINNIKKYTWLKRVNQSASRKFKYGEALPIDMKSKDILEKWHNETTFSSWKTPSVNILWNLEAGFIDIGMTDITSSDLEKAIQKQWNVKGIKSSKKDPDGLKWHLINTANARWFTHDSVTTFLGLATERKDSHVFHTVVNKEIVLYKKTWEKVLIKKSYDIYIRPECNNILVVPWSKNFGEILLQKDFNMDITSLKTPTFPITLNMIKALADVFKSKDKAWWKDGNWWWGWGSEWGTHWETWWNSWNSGWNTGWGETF